MIGISTSVHSATPEKDSDKDGLSDVYEDEIGSESYLSDTDGDGIDDAKEVGTNLNKPIDSDNDGVIDILDYDDDNDGLPTFLESKTDSDKDGLLDYLDTDSDNDSVLDGEETATLNKDENFDGIDDAFDANREGFVDVNGDGIDDNVKLPDHNNDGTPDYLDANYPEQTNETVIVKNESETKADTTKTPLTNDNKDEGIIKVSAVKNSETTDTKLKGSELKDSEIKETKEESTSKEKEPESVVEKEKSEEVKPAIPKVLVSNSTDSDNDGLSNELESILKTDPMKRDSDGDNVSDAIEIGLDVNAPLDTDNDGIIDALDDDDDNDGVMTKFEDLNKDSTAINDDTDADGIPNYLDDNDDGDSFLTKDESIVWDSDNDGILDYLDNSDGRKGIVNATNTIRVINTEDMPKKPEVVVLYDGGATVNASADTVDSGFQMTITDTAPEANVKINSPVLNDIVSANLNQQLPEKTFTEKASQSTQSVDIKINDSPVIQSTSSSGDKKSAKSHWELF